MGRSTQLTQDELECILMSYSQPMTGAAPLLGFGGSNTRFHQTTNTGNKQMMCRKSQVAPCDITTFESIVWAGYSISSTGLEVGFTAVSTDTMTVEASIEYPAGTFWRLTFSGSNQGTLKLAINLAGGGATLPENLLWSDPLTGFGTIPAGAIYWVNFWTDSTAGIMYHNGHRDAANGDLLNVGVVAPNSVMGGAFVQNAGVAPCGSPAAIIAHVTPTAVGVVGCGDSIMFGQGHTITALTDFRVGIVGPCLPVGTPFVNLGMPGANCTDWYGRLVNGNVFIQYGSHYINNLGVNGADTAAAKLASQQGLLIYPTRARKKYLATITPRSTGGNWTATPGVQVATAADATTYRPYNTLVRALPAGFDGFFETRLGALEFAPDTGLWQNNAGVALTSDGLHPNTGGYDWVFTSGVNPASLWT